MILRDWREAPQEMLAPAMEGERDRWLRHLQWDPSAAWRDVEQARTTWGLPGLIAVDASGTGGRPRDGRKVRLGNLVRPSVIPASKVAPGMVAQRAGMRSDRLVSGARGAKMAGLLASGV